MPRSELMQDIQHESTVETKFLDSLSSP
jgi:hypothetical protein